jgi:hypothetical protein
MGACRDYDDALRDAALFFRALGSINIDFSIVGFCFWKF